MIPIDTQLQSWELREPFATARDCITHLPVLFIELTGREGARGRAEAAGVDYAGETPASMAGQLASVQGQLHAGVTGEDLLALLPAGGARNALDCALWDLRAKEGGVPAASAAEWHAYRARFERELTLPVCDPLRGGVAPLAEALRAI